MYSWSISGHQIWVKKPLSDITKIHTYLTHKHFQQLKAALSPSAWGTVPPSSLPYLSRKSSRFQRSRICSCKLFLSRPSSGHRWRWRGRRRTRPDSLPAAGHLRRGRGQRLSPSRQPTEEGRRLDLTCCETEEKQHLHPPVLLLLLCQRLLSSPPLYPHLQVLPLHFRLVDHAGGLSGRDNPDWEVVVGV